MFSIVLIISGSSTILTRYYYNYYYFHYHYHYRYHYNCNNFFYSFLQDVLVRKSFYQNHSHHFRLDEPTGKNLLIIPSANLDNGLKIFFFFNVRCLDVLFFYRSIYLCVCFDFLVDITQFSIIREIVTFLSLSQVQWYWE